jgi:hypothetical protein
MELKEMEGAVVKLGKPEVLTTSGRLNCNCYKYLSNKHLITAYIEAGILKK